MKVLALLATLTGGLFAHPYIHLSTSRIYSPGEETEIRLETRDLDVIHFRLYAIEDPIDFFEAQKNMRSPRVRGKAKPVNFFHMLEGLGDRTKRNTRYLAREMMSKESRIGLRDYLGLPPLEKKEAETPERFGPSSIPRLEGYEVLREWSMGFEKKKKDKDDYYYYGRYHYETIDLEITKPGVYLVEAYYGTRVAYTPVVVSEMSVVTKQDPREVYVFAVNAEDGKPRRGAVVVVLSDTNRIATGRTDGKGLFHTSFDTTRLRVLVQDGDNFALLDKYYYYSDEKDQDGAIKVYLHTERPIYRPEQTVYFKGVVRRMRRGTYRTPAGDEVEVVVTDPEGNEIYRHTLASDSWGAFADSLIVPSSSRLGRYTLSATLEETYHSVQFRVEEYRKPSYKVEVELDAEQYVQGDTVKIEVAADYFFGAPVAKAETKLKIYRREHHRYYWYGTSYMDELAGKTDSQGRITFTYVTPKKDRNYRYTFEAQVRDESRRAESGEASAFVASSAVLVDLKPTRYVVEPGEKLEIDIHTHDILNKPVPGTVEIVVYRHYWDKEDKVLARRTMSVGKIGFTTFTFTPSQAGPYYVIAKAKDKQGNQSEEKRWFYSSERGGYYTWKTDRIQIIFDAETYEVGDWAEALVITPYENASIIASLEADNLYDVDIIELEGNTAMLRFKVRSEFVPNVFLSVCGIYEGEFFEHKEKMLVNRKARMLTVELVPERQRYEPGERAKLNVLVKDVRGKPIKADISLAVVDEALYSLAAEIAPSIEDYFYGERADQVATSSSVYYSFYGYERQYQMLSAAAADSVVLAAYKGREEPKVRKKFKDVAYWNAFVRTDGSGRAQVELIWPDNLTTWRATARAISMDTKVGESREKILVTKDLLVRIIPPRFVTERDSLLIPTIVHNYTRTSQEVKLSFSVKGLKLFDNTAHTDTIQPGSTFRVDWPVRCEVPGDVTLTAKAIGSSASDAMELTIPANPHGIERNLVISAFMPKPDQGISRTFSIPEEAELRTITGKLTLTPTLSSALFAGLSYLAKYPYGCVEQTMSCFFPDLVVADLIRDPKRGDPQLAAELPKMIAKGLAKLYGYQHSDGGWGWFEHDETMHFNTTYVMHGLLYATQLGYDVNPTVIRRGLEAINRMLRKDKDVATTDRAYMLYALSMAPDQDKEFIKAQLAALEKTQLDPYSQAFMALSYHEIGEDPKARQTLERLKQEAIADEEMVYWSGRVHIFARWQDDPVEITATTLRAFLAIYPSDGMIPKIIYWLLRERRGNHWKSSKDSALALLALAEFFKTTKDTSPRMEIEFLLNNRRIASYKISQYEILQFNRPLDLELSGVVHGENSLKIQKKGSGNLFTSLVFSYYSKEEGITAGGTELKIQREYYRLIPRVEKDRLVYDKKRLSGPVKVGEPLFVKLYVDCTENFEYVMIQDPIPAGFEVAKDNSRYPISGERYWWGYYDYESWGYMYSGREIHDDHTALFISRLWGGRRELSYVIEPYVPGVYHTMPAVVSLMYFPDKRGHSSEAVITVIEE
ncbi:hypothetical protein CEE36_03275 [candidate division TA06 bacterium B3_TA06]|uniref:Alpha-2-macroglobulin n=1 Tax=candidate division TA06 bacterium B3_TA06 TaxID=2012487 RepID=A0A532V956_UNCT6|nr:MAG: hypothetical protein CEE36_03275 [candidate division TA06 bacterium B3_TA06]